MSQEAGQQLLHFSLIEKIGEGGMGVVWKARDEKQQGRIVALKVLRTEFVENQEYKWRFLQEARLTGALSHPFIATLYYADDSGGSLLMAMEYVEGRTLRSLIGEKPMALEDVERYALEVAEGLVTAHAAQLVHRDLKPENVMVGVNGHVKILDFGLAKIVEQRDRLTSLALDSTQAAPAGRTGEGTILGTPGYMSPEQARGEPVDSRSDVFSFGVMLYEMVTGHAPFRGLTMLDTLTAILGQTPVPPSLLRPEMRPDLERIILRCLDKRPEDRYNDTRDLVAALRSLQRFSPSPAIPPKSAQRNVLARMAPETTGRWAVAGGSVLLVLLVAALLLPGPMHRFFSRGAAATSGKPLLAVLFFDNLGPSSDDDYLAAGLTEDIITSLSQVNGLGVLSRSAVERYRGRDIDPRTVRTDLGATFLLEGSIRKIKDDLIVTAQLIETKGGEHVWAKRFQSPLTGIFAVQDTIAFGIARALRVPVGGEEAQLVSRRWTTNATAYSYYLLGRERYWDSKSPRRCGEARQWFEKALSLDPDYAPALAGLAQTISAEMIPFMDGILVPGALEKGLQLARRAITLDQDLAVGWRAEALAYYRMKRYEEAMAAIKQAIQVNPHVPESYSLLGECYRVQGQWAEAESTGLKAIEVDPYSPLSFEALAHAYLGQGKHEEAERVLLDASRRLPDDPGILGLQLDVLRQQGRREDMVELLRHALNIHPDNFFACAQLGTLLRQMDRTAEADSVFGKILEQWPNEPQAFNAAGAHFAERHKYATARELLEKAVRLAPNHFEAWANLSRCAEEDGHIQEAEAIDKQRITRWPDDPGPIRDLAGLREREKRLGEAEKLFLDRTDRWPRNQDVLLDMAQFYNRQNRHDVAERWARKAIEIYPRAAGPYMQLGWESWSQGRYDLAATSFQKGIELQPMNFQGYRGLGRTFEYTRQPEKEVQILELWVKLNPGHALGWNTLGYHLSGQGKDFQAAAAWEKALHLDPRLPNAANNLGLAYAGMHQYEKAIQMLLHAAELDTENTTGVLNAADLAFNVLADDALARTQANRALGIAQRGRRPLYAYAWAQYLLSEIDDKNGNGAEAGRHLAASLEEIKRLEHEFPHDLYVIRLAAHVYGASSHIEKARACAEHALKIKGNSADVLFDMSCAMASAGDVQRAMEYLKLAIAAGYDDKEFMMRTRECAAARKDPRFQDIVGSLP